MGYALQEVMLISYKVLTGILLILKSHFKIKISLLLNKQMQGSQRWQFLLINGHILWCGRVTLMLWKEGLLIKFHLMGFRIF